MSPILGEQDEFEGLYTEVFRDLARPYGEFVKYERDRAALDIGLHLTEKTSRYRTVANSRVWFQLKGVRATTLSLREFEESSEISLDLDVEDLKFWYASPEVVYVALYIEAAKVFLAEDIRDLVDRRSGGAVFSPDTFKPDQKKARVKFPRGALLDDAAWSRMLRHRSMRIDGPSFRGRPLGHRLDPLRSQLARMGPDVFTGLVEKLLEAHRYGIEETLDPSVIFPNAAASGDTLLLSKGTLHCTYEWVLQMTTTFGFDGGSDGFREEGSPLHAQGHVAVLIHADKRSKPSPDLVRAFASALASDGVENLLVFVNDRPDPPYFGTFFASARETGVQCVPQHLGDLAFSVLTATNVYLEFRDRITWKYVNYLY